MCSNRRLVGSCHDHRRLPASSSSADERAGDDGADGELANRLHALHPKSASCRMCERRLVRLRRALGAPRPREHTERRVAKARGRGSDRDVPAIPRYGRNVTTHAVLAGRIPVTRVTPALPDGRWRPKAFEGEVVPFRATVFREGHDQVGAMLVLTSPSGEVRRERMSPLAPGTDRWEAEGAARRAGRLALARHRLRRRGRHVAARRRAQDRRRASTSSSCSRSARASSIAPSPRSRARSRRGRASRALAAGLRDGGASVADRRALVDDAAPSTSSPPGRSRSSRPTPPSTRSSSSAGARASAPGTSSSRAPRARDA